VGQIQRLLGKCPDTLNKYLRFRHVFRNAFSFDLVWRKMSPLAEGKRNAEIAAILNLSPRTVERMRLTEHV
jgi:hypothetical protein